MGWVQNASPEVEASSNYPTIISVCISMTVFMVAVVGLRIYVRAVMLKVMGLDDWTIAFAAICSIIYNGLCLEQSRWGLGLPVALRPAQNLNQYSVINSAGQPWYIIGILGFKVALCLTYLRILSFGQRAYRFIVWFVLTMCVLGHGAGTLVLIFQCQPVQKSWLPLTPGECLGNVPTFEAIAIMTIIFDVIIFLLPIPLIWNLQINPRRKAALICIFSLALLTIVCSILRMTRIPALAVDGNSTFVVLWGTIEMNVGIALTCFPALAPLFTYFRERNSTYQTYPPRHPFDAHPTHSADGITVPTPAILRNNPSYIASESNQYLQSSRSRDGDSEMGILSPSIFSPVVSQILYPRRSITGASKNATLGIISLYKSEEGLDGDCIAKIDSRW